MAPLDIGDRINLAALAGTWVGTLFTAIGLIALFSQMRSVLVNLQQSKKALLTGSTGLWMAVIPQKGMPHRGLVESVAPGVWGWVQRAYAENRHAGLTQDHKRFAVTGSWSNLIAHRDIQATDLIRFGGPDARVLPAVTGDLGPGAPRLADLIFDNGRVLYDFTQNEFMALLIICGFSAADFLISGCTMTTNFLGSMQLTDSEPFSQVARFDAHEGCREIVEDKERYIDAVSVQTCDEYAIGLLRTPERGDHSIIIPAKVSSTAAEHAQLTAWTTKPQATQCGEIRYALEQLISVSGANVTKDSVETSKDIEYGSSAMDTICPSNNFGKAKIRETLLIAHALAALRPWGLLPVFPGENEFRLKG